MRRAGSSRAGGPPSRVPGGPPLGVGRSALRRQSAEASPLGPRAPKFCGAAAVRSAVASRATGRSRALPRRGASFRLVLLLDRRARPERDTETKDLSSRRPKPQIPRFTGTGSLPTQNEASPPRGRARAGSRSSPSDEDERVPGSLRCPAASPLSLRAGEWKGRSHVAWAREGFRRYSRSPTAARASARVAYSRARAILSSRMSMTIAKYSGGTSMPLPLARPLYRR
jgi:hypothetical protein